MKTFHLLTGKYLCFLVGLYAYQEVNPLTAVLAKTGRTRLLCFKTLQLSQSREHCLNCQYNVLQIAFCKISPFELDKNKDETQKSSVIVAKPKVNIHGKIQSLFLLRSDFFVLIRFPFRATAFYSGASWPCLDFHIQTTSTATSTYHRNFALVVIFSGRKFQDMPWQVKKFISSPVPKRLRFGAAIF